MLSFKRMYVYCRYKMYKYICLPSQFYFGDRNFSKDKFLKDKAEEDDGCILKHFLQTKVLDNILW